MKVRQYIKQDIIVRLLALTENYQRSRQNSEIFEQIIQLWTMLAQGALTPIEKAV